MTVVAELVDWITKNPASLFGALGPAGLFGWWVGRQRVKIRAVGPSGPDERFIHFDAENISEKVTSLEPTFGLTGYTPRRKSAKYLFSVQGTDRTLQPHMSKTVVAAHDNTSGRGDLLFLWYMTIRVKPTRGRSATFRCRNSDFKELGLLSFYSGLLAFKLFGWVPIPSPTSKNTALAIVAQHQANETLVAGNPEHPELPEHKHRVAVVKVKLVNESKLTRAQVTKVQAYLRNGDPLPISWSDAIDAFGNPTQSGGLLVVDIENTLFIRHNSGQSVNYARIVITHNLPKSPLTVIHDDWGGVATEPFKGE